MTNISKIINRLVVLSLSVMTLSGGAKMTLALNKDNVAENMQSAFDPAYNTVSDYSYEAQEKWGEMRSRFDSANEIWKEYAGVDFSELFSDSFDEVSSQISDSQKTIAESDIDFKDYIK